MPTQLHLAENPLPLHLFLERFQRLVDVVVTHEDLHLAAYSFPVRSRWPRRPPVGRDRPSPEEPGAGWRYNMALNTYKPIFHRVPHEGEIHEDGTERTWLY